MSSLKELYDEYKAKNEGVSYESLAKLTGVKNGTYVSLAVSGWGDYKLSLSNKKEVEKRLFNFFNSQNKNSAFEYEDILKKAGLLVFENSLIVLSNIIRAMNQRTLLKIVGKSGSGKTEAVKAFSALNPQTVIITAYLGMTAKELLEEIAQNIGIAVLPKSQKELMKGIKNRLLSVGGRKLIIIDEANFISERSLEQIRHIQDQTKTPLVLVGTEALDYKIKQSHEQVATRIRACNRDLVPFGENEVKALFESKSFKIDDKQAKTVWSKCKNLREVKYMIEDLIEMHDSDISRLKELL